MTTAPSDLCSELEESFAFLLAEASQLDEEERAQADLGDGWWGQPFDDGINTQAAIFWGDECCAECSWCPICQGR